MLAGMSNQYDETSLVNSVLVAALTGNLIELSRLLDGGADINIQNEIGQTPLLAASIANQVQVFQLLLDRGADICHCDTGGYTVLHLTSSSEILEMVLNHPSIQGRKHVIVNAKTKLGRTALHEASFHGPLARVNILLQHKALVNVEDSNLSTPLHYALCSLEKEMIVEVVNALIDAGADVNKQNIFMKTPLLLTCTFQKENIGLPGIKRLLELGADPAITDIDGNNALHALLKGLEFIQTPVPMEVIDHLLKTNPKILNSANRYGEYPVHMVLEHTKKDADVIRHLVDAGADVSFKDSLGRTFLHFCCQYNMLKEMAPFFEYSDMVNEVDCLGRTILHYGVLFSSDGSSVEQILQMKDFQNVHEKDKYGLRAIDYASRSSNNTIRQLSRILAVDELDYYHTITASRSSAGSLDSESCMQRLLSPVAVESFDGVLPTSLRPVTESEDYITELWTHCSSPTKNIELFNECKHVIETFMQKVVSSMQLEDDRFSGVIIGNGSSFEETKVNAADEYDFLLQLDDLSDLCQARESENDPAGYVRVERVPGKGLGKYANLFDADGFVDCQKVMSRFAQLAMKALHNPEVWESSGLDFAPMFSAQWKQRPAFTIQCTQRVPVVIYGVSIDFLPAVQIKNWWPRDTQGGTLMTDDVKKSGCHLIIKPVDVPHYQHARFGIPRQFLRITFSRAETIIFTSVPGYIRKSYMVAKILRERSSRLPFRLVWDDETLKNARGNFLLKNCISSYLIKQCLLKELKKELPEEVPESEEVENRLMGQWVQTIFKSLNDSYQTGSLPSPFLPSQNLLHTFRPDETTERVACVLLQLMDHSLSKDNTPVNITRHVCRQRATSEFELKMHRRFQTLERLLQGPEDRP